ncbi:uncharacterized protein LOC114245333 isoform X1 [Bombyx mandarina]|uniref:Uncharacterized protein n=2 Tax=Bombyx TaxID=7090 RepID=A0A8R2AN78_BOMMO|nr:uncharacterized protein LOC101739083 isoform X1 [Bombyx mori]XP_028033271.1 uncharacterized protein LOC114245333 isoform X1 [Bombyx mandarina]
MPANTIESCLQGARYNFDAVRPAPICGDANQPGQCHNVHISTNFYYGFHEVKTSGINHMATDCEMQEVPIEKNVNTLVTTARKRSADNSGYPQSKRFREEVQRKKNIGPETHETAKLKPSSEDILESLFWNIHGGHFYSYLNCASSL